MTTVMPQSELTRKAATWVNEMLETPDHKGLDALIEEAGARFNLGPRDMELLIRFFKDKQD